jgi:hypothetical protein
MNNLGAFGLLTIAIGVAAIFVLVGAIPVLVARNLITRRPAATHLKEWLFYVLGAALLIITFESFYFYSKYRGINEYTTVKWMNILNTAVIVFGSAAKKLWRSRAKWPFWAALCLLTVGHFTFLSRLHWPEAGYLWLPVVIGVPEFALIMFLLGRAFDSRGLRKPKSW